MMKAEASSAAASLTAKTISAIHSQSQRTREAAKTPGTKISTMLLSFAQSVLQCTLFGRREILKPRVLAELPKL